MYYLISLETKVHDGHHWAKTSVWTALCSTGESGESLFLLCQFSEAAHIPWLVMPSPTFKASSWCAPAFLSLSFHHPISFSDCPGESVSTFGSLDNLG